MRPVRLELEGFTAFRARTELDLADVDLFALTGPTGAGKTSLVDAITFALYGSVPRFDDRRAVAPVISQGAVEARVRLDFTVDDVGYTAVRVVRATKTGASTKEARLQRGEEVLAGDADGVTAAVVDLLGLSFEHFTTCVSLPQGAFARFLHDKPRERQDLLVSLLDLRLYERLGQRARQRAATARDRIGLLDGRLERLAASSPEALELATARVATLDALRDLIDEARPRLDALVSAAERAEAAVEAAVAQVASLQLAPPDGVRQLAVEVAEAKGACVDATAADEAAAGALTAAEHALIGLPTLPELDAVERNLAAHADLVAQIAKGEDALASATAAAAAADEAAVRAAAARSEAAAALEAARTTHRAHALVGSLRVGEPCPVCQQEVRAVPDLAAPDLAAAEAAMAPLDQAARTADGAAAAARTHLARVETKLAGLREQQVAGDQALAGAPDPEALQRARAERSAAEAAVASAKASSTEARAARAAADRRLTQIADAEDAARRAFDGARDRVAALGPPAADRRDLADDWDALVAWAAERRTALEGELVEHRKAAAEAQTAAAALSAELVAAGAAAGIDVAPPKLRDAVADALARAEAEVRRITDDLAEVATVTAERAALSTDEQVAASLAQHLSASGFEQWVLDEALQRLVDGASRTLLELTTGTYSMALDSRSSFCVIDHANADAVRSARTLSGGETFLASLALALALADEVAALAAGGAARLDSIFLDEGFGTLDADALDTVAAALDELGARGRMVGVVTHVRDLAERMPVRFEVRKAGGTASIERVAG